MDSLHLDYKELLEPKIQTTPQSQLFYLRPSFKELTFFRNDEPQLQTFQEYKEEVKVEEEIKSKSSKDSKKEYNHSSKKPQHVKKRRSKTLGEKVGLWSSDEHALFMKGYEKYGRNWSQIAQEFCTLRTRQQVRSHAQKFFRKFEED
eukprot:gene9631-1835_t